MAKYIFGLLLLSFSYSYAQKNITIIGELRLDLAKWHTKDEMRASVPYEFFNSHYAIKLYASVLSRRIPLEVKLIPKEEYYDQNSRVVEVRILIPGELLPKERSKVTVEGQIVSKDNSVQHPLKDFDITFPKSTDSISYVNQTTFKMKSYIPIASPEEVSIKIITDYIDQNVFRDPLGTKEEQSVYRGIFIEMEKLTGPGYIPGKLNYTQLANLYKLLNFIEPFVSDSSFFNDEGRKLKMHIDSISKQLADTILLSPGLKSDPGQMRHLKIQLTNYELMSATYLGYQESIKKVQQTCKILRDAVFYEAPVQSGRKLVKPKERHIFFSFGPTLYWGLTNSYNVTVSKTDTTIHFQKNSAVSFVLSAGLIWTPNKFEKKIGDSSRWNPVVVGMFLDYYLYSSIKPRSSNSPFGCSVGVGYQTANKLAALVTIGFRNLRQPTDYLKSFGEKKLPPGMDLDINDNSQFGNRIYCSLGVSIHYVFGNTKFRK